MLYLYAIFRADQPAEMIPGLALLMVKNITFITVNYAPEDTAIGLYTSQLAEYLAANGYTVSVITGFPYYPMWKIPENYRDKPRFYSEEINGVRIFRYRFYVPSQQNFLRRILHILSFNAGNAFNLRKIKKADLVFCNIPFTTNVMMGFALRRRLGAKVWTSIKDFEFDAAFESGLLRENILTKAFRKALLRTERHLYSKSDVVSSISLNMLERIRQKAPGTDPFFFPDWVDVDFINPRTHSHHPYIDREKFTVLYSGNIGQKQNWDIYIELAHRLKHHQDLEFVLVGEGGHREEFLDRLRKEGLDGFVRYQSPVPYEELSDLLCSADLHVLFQKEDVSDSVMPSKILGMMSSARPSLITGDKASEVARHIAESQGRGFFSNAETEAILDYIVELKQDKALRDEIGLRARGYMVSNFSKDNILQSFIKKINTLR